MHAIRNRILSAITGSLAMHGLAGCGVAETTGPGSDASGDMAATDGVTVADSPADGADDAVSAADAMAGAGTAADACTCSMLYGPCGAANPCGCCTGQQLICTGNNICFTTIRRPFLVGASLRSATAVARGDWARDLAPPLAALDERTASALRRGWLDDALQEHASVAAFARFTLQMLAVGAPPELIVASQRASLDEVAHARACFGLARRYGGRDVGPSALDVHDALGRTSVVSLGALTAEEGCAGETLGAALVAEQLAVAD